MQLLPWVLLLTIALGSVSAVGAEEKKDEEQIAHIVFFSLKDNSDEAKKKLVAACDKYLSGHPGTVYYSAGIIAADFDRDVNVRDFDVSLHIVFENKAAHDKYQDDEKHLQFIKEGKDNWKKVRVFDSRVKKPSK